MRPPPVPFAWQPVLEAIEELAALAAAKGGPTPERRAAASAIRKRLLALAPRLAEEPPEALASGTPEHRLWFTQAALLWMHFAEVGGVRLDTLGSLTLTRFPVDLEPSPSDHALLRAGLARAFGWTREELHGLEVELAPTMASLRLKIALTKVVQERYLASLSGGLAAQRTATGPLTLRLMKLCYGDVPFHPEDVDLVVTSTALFFCIPYRGESLDTAGFAERPKRERHAVARFLAHLNEANTALTDRFPSFGWFDRAALSADLVSDLTASVSAAGTPASEAEVREALITMVSILPTHLVEQYLIHDGWGHVWQEALCDFEAPYRKLVHVSEPLVPDTGPLFGGAGTPRLADAFRNVDGKTVLDEDALARCTSADLAGRIQSGLGAVVSEVLADLVEHKFVRRVHPPVEVFTSTSLLPDEPLKVDLTLTDLRAHVRYWRRPYRALARDRAARRVLEEQLATAGSPREGLAEAVEAAGALLEVWYAPLLSRRMDAWRNVVSPAGLEITIVHRVMLNMVALDAELDRFLAEADAARHAGPAWRDPATCVDLLVLLLGWFYERDRARYVFNLDELVRTSLRPSMEKLRAALDEVAAAPPEPELF